MKTNVKLAIKSCHRFPERRQAQRDTWLREFDEDFFFVVGGVALDEPDILHARGCSDEFANIAPKVLVAIRYALDENVTNLCIADDDTYIQPARLMNSGFEKFDYVGWVRTGGYSATTNTPYIQGSCFWLSERSMHFIVAQADKMCNNVIDDGAVGACLVDNVPFTHDWRYEPGPYPQLSRIPQAENTVISCHKCGPKVMREVHEKWLSSQK